MNKKKKRIIALSVIAALFLTTVIWIAWGNTALEVNTYSVAHKDLPESFNGFRIAQVSDLHDAEIGKENSRLIAMLRDANPDIIAFTGDMVDSRRTDIDATLRFVNEAVKIAPCYYVTGNHEANIEEYDELKAGLIAAGVTVLENERVELELDGETITIIGIHDLLFDESGRSGSKKAITRAFLNELVKEDDGFTLLLAHRPEVFDVYVESGIDLALTGHVHGGQFRIPFVGGLYVPNQGFFPEYDAGLFTEDNTNMIISRGIGNSAFPFRINNRPEIVLVELSRQE